MSTNDTQDAPRTSGPRLTIDQDATASELSSKTTAEASASQEEDVDLREAVGFIKGLGIMMWRYAESHPHTVLYGFIGFVLAVLILVLGLWNTIVIAVFVAVGAMLGQARDGDNAIVNFFGKLFDRH